MAKTTLYAGGEGGNLYMSCVDIGTQADMSQEFCPRL